MTATIVGSHEEAARWCRDHGLSPDTTWVASEPQDEWKLRYPDRQAIQLERPHPVLDRILTAAKAHRGTPPRGLFIVFEGGEGSGKSTQARHLVKHLYERGCDITVTREPGATRLGYGLRSLLLDERQDPPTARAEALMYAADRAHHVQTVVRPSLARGSMVVCDRYVDSFDAYQGAGRKIDHQHVDWLIQFATDGLVPDLTVVLDVDPAVGLSRVIHRGDVNRLDAEEIAFHHAARQRFLDLADSRPWRYLVLPGDRTAKQIANAVAMRADAMLAERDSAEVTRVAL